MIDELCYESLKWAQNSDPLWYQRMMRHSYFQRQTVHFEDDYHVQPWEGITWVLDLLPHWPKDALAALDAYFLAHAQMLPDGRLQGMSDAMAILRAWYIGSPGTHLERIDAVKELSPRDFEYLVYSLYKHLGYTCILTPPQKDGGRDIVATRSELGGADSIRVECKRWVSRVGVAYVRSLLGVVSSEKANKGAIVTTSRFTKVARAFAVANPRVELIDGPALITMLNTHLGTSWATRIEASSRSAAAKRLRQAPNFRVQRTWPAAFQCSKRNTIARRGPRR